jgi:hypothetical protein
MTVARRMLVAVLALGDVGQGAEVADLDAEGGQFLVEHGPAEIGAGAVFDGSPDENLEGLHQAAESPSAGTFIAGLTASGTRTGPLRRSLVSVAATVASA